MSKVLLIVNGATGKMREKAYGPLVDPRFEPLIQFMGTYFDEKERPWEIADFALPFERWSVCYNETKSEALTETQ